MMIYRKKNRGQKISFFIFCTILFLVLAFGFFKIDFFHNAAQAVLTPFIKIQSIVGSPFKNIGAYFSSKQSLSSQVATLEEEVNDLRIQSIKLQSAVIENSELRSLKEGSIQESSVLAKVLVHPPRSPYDTLVIDQGTDAGISNGSAVFYKDAILGRIHDASGRSAVVRLISSSGMETPIRIQGQYEGVARGTGGGRIKIILPKDTPADMGDIVTMSDSSSSVVGVVSEIEVNDIDSFKALYVSLPISISSISFVEVVL